MIYDPGLIGQRIKSAREDRNLTIKELTELLGLSESTVNQYEAGCVVKIKLLALPSTTDILDVQEEYLLGVIDKKQSSDDITLMSDYKYVPTSVVVDSPVEIDGLQGLPTLQLPETSLGKYSDRRDLILTRVNGESMNRIIRSGSWIVIITKIELDNLKSGNLVIFNKDYEYSLEEYHGLGDKILFRPLSTDLAYKEIRCKGDKDLRIIGKVIMYSITLDQQPSWGLVALGGERRKITTSFKSREEKDLEKQVKEKEKIDKFLSCYNLNDVNKRDQANILDMARQDSALSLLDTGAFLSGDEKDSL